MSYKYLLTFLGGILIALGFLAGGWLLVLVWLGVDFIVLGVAHLRGVHRIFGKKSDGTLPWWSWISFFPLLSYTIIIWHLMLLFSRERAQVEVVKGVTVGRRLLPFEVDGEFENYVDLTTEFSEPFAIRGSPAYICFPILDGAAPTPGELRDAVNHLRPGRTFIHCAQGHGRTGLFALAVLLKSGNAKTVEEGLEILTMVRPGIRLNKQQRKCIQLYVEQMK